MVKEPQGCSHNMNTPVGLIIPGCGLSGYQETEESKHSSSSSY